MENVIKQPTYREKLMGCFLGVLLGDTLGMPFETMTVREIILATNGRGMTGFSKPIQLKIRDTRDLQAGDYTDDWRLTRAVAKSLIISRGFNLMNQAREHLLELEDSYVGFGASTLQNLLAILATAPKDWKNNSQVQLQLPQLSELKKSGGGNGIAMKIAPLAIYFHNDADKFFAATVALAGLTHRDPQAALSAYALGIMMSRLYRQSIGLAGPKQLQLEIKKLMQEVVDETLQRQRELLTTLGHRYPQDPTDLSIKLVELNRMVKSGDLAKIDLVREKIGTGFYCAQSIPFSIAMFLRNATDFRDCIHESVNSGGDTDSNASMAGALCGLNLGAMAIPEEWRKYRYDYRETSELALQLYNII